MNWGQPQRIILPPPLLLSFSSTPPPHILLVLLLFSVSHTHSLTHTHIHILTRTHTTKRDSIPSLPYRFEKEQSVWISSVQFSCSVVSNSLQPHELQQARPPCPEKAMALHSSTFAWKIPWTEEPGRLQSMGSLRVRHNWATSLSLFTFMHWRRKWQPTPVFLPWESRERGSLVGCCLWGHTESDTIEAT